MDVRYTVRYSHRKSIGIKINQDSSVTVTAPFGTTSETIERVVQKHSGWIQGHIGPVGGAGRRTAGESENPAPGERTVVCDGREIPYAVVYSDRRSISVKINYDMSVVVRAPYGTTDKRIAEFMSGRAGWIASHFGHIEDERGRYEDVVKYKTILLSGNEYGLCLGETTRLTEDTLYLKNWGVLSSFVVRNFGEALAEKTRETAEELGLILNDVRFRSYKARWGCCDSKGVVTFNYKLLMIPEDLQLYVAVHELCHLVEMNHSSKFWKAVEAVMPDYKERHEKSHEYDFLLRLYP